MSQNYPATDQEVVDAIATYLGTRESWSGADALEVIADAVGRVRPHPGGDDSEFRREFEELTGRALPESYDGGERLPEDDEEVEEFQVQGNYGGSAGWESLTWEETLEDAKAALRTYQENEPQYRHRIADAGGTPIEEKN